MKLKFAESQIGDIAGRYPLPREEKELINLRENVEAKGELSKEQLKLVAKWKAPRSAGHVDKNSDEYVKEVTSFAFSAKNERTRIEALTILDGVSWPTASVLLHLYHKENYPILDFRALWSAGLAVPKHYSYSFWEPYVLFCRELAQRNDVSMRILDRAMWQYSKENQKA